MAGPTELLDALRALLLSDARLASGPGTLPAGATAAEFAAVRFGGPTKLKFDSVTVNTSNTKVLGNNPKRVFWLLINRSANQGEIGFDQTLTTANGIPLTPGGGAASMAVEEDGEPVAWEVYAINETAAGLWARLEIERV